MPPLGAHHQPGGRGGHPGGGNSTGWLAGDGGKVQRAARRAGAPGNVWTRGQAPILARMRREARGLG